MGMGQKVSSGQAMRIQTGRGTEFRYPVHAVWCITNQCNARCLHCSSNSSERCAKELSTAEGINLLDELKDTGIFDISITGGEPLLREDLLEIVGHATKIGLRVGLGTNGLLVNKRILRNLRKLRLHRFQVSLDGVGDSHDMIRGTPELYKKAIEAVAASISEGLRTNVCFTPQKVNYKELSVVIDIAAKFGAANFNLSQYVPVGRGDIKLDLSKEQWFSVMKLWHLKRKEYKGKMGLTAHLSMLHLLAPDISHKPAFRGCQAGNGMCSITPEGYLTPCVLLPIRIGNLLKTEFRQIWDTSELIQQLKSRALIHGYCGNCEYKLGCGGCRAAAYAYTGDPFSQDPRCWAPPQPS